MNKLFAVTAALSASAASAKISPEMKEHLATMQRDGLSASSPLGRQLLGVSRRVEQAATYAADISFVSEFSIKFQGCHHVTQWATDEDIEAEQEANDDDGDDQDDVALNSRIRSKGLVRYRLCPTDKCMDNFKMGCSSNYGEYVVDMTSFLQVYIAYMVEMNEYNCEKYSTTCFNECYQSTSANCYSSCYKKYDVNAALCSKNGNNNGNNADAYSNYDAYASSAYGDNQFDLETYIECGEYEVAAEDGEEIAHYLGPYCADQGGDIRLGFFQDATCTIPSSYQASYFEKMTGVEIPYTKKSLVDTNCMSCASTEAEAEAQYNQDYYNYDANGNRNYYIAKEVNEMCGSMYMTSGKCESNFNADEQPYPEEGACSYIESVKNLQGDGIIRSDQQQSSKPAAVAIGVFTGMSVLMGGYVYHLKSMIARSAVNLSGATTSLA